MRRTVGGRTVAPTQKRLRLKRTGAGKLVATRVAMWRPKTPPMPAKPKPLAKTVNTALPALDRRPQLAPTKVKPSAPTRSRRRPIGRTRTPRPSVHKH